MHPKVFCSFDVASFCCQRNLYDSSPTRTRVPSLLNSPLKQPTQQGRPSPPPQGREWYLREISRILLHSSSLLSHPMVWRTLRTKMPLPFHPVAWRTHSVPKQPYQLTPMVWKTPCTKELLSFVDSCGSCSVRDPLLLVCPSEVLWGRWHSGSLGWCRNISPDPLSASCPTHETTVLPSAITSYHLVCFLLPRWLRWPPRTSCTLHTTAPATAYFCSMGRSPGLDSPQLTSEAWTITYHP